MTFAELLEEVMENVGDGAVRGEAKRLMNLAMREISLKTGLPTLYVTVPGDDTYQVGSFLLPNAYHPEGIKYAEIIDVIDGDHPDALMGNREIAVMSIADANRFHPGWGADGYRGIPMLIYNPLSSDAGFRPTHIRSARYRFLVHAVPNPMVEDGDEPFSVFDHCENPPIRRSGAMPAFHRILAHHVSYELLQRAGDDRWQAFFARYRAMEEEIFNAGDQHDLFLPRLRNDRRVMRRV